MRKGFEPYAANEWHEISVDANDIMACSVDNSCLKPIPLTEEWMPRLGFQPHENGGYYRQVEWLNWGYLVRFSETGIVVRQGFMNQWSELASVQYVHQLQNIYHAMTGLELSEP